MENTKKPDIRKTVDELGAIEKRLAPYKADISRAEDLRKQLRALHAADEYRADSEIHCEGETFRAVLGPKTNLTLIDTARVIRSIKAAAWAKFSTCTLTALKANVSAEIFAASTKVEQTGPRSLRTFPK